MARKIFLADLNYIESGKQWTIIPFPLSIAYIGSFAKHVLGDAIEVRLFKAPHKLLAALETEQPDLVAFSSYIWNKNLQLGFVRLVKERYPQCITVMGGPNYNFTELEWVERFAKNNRQIDFHIEGEGEAKFCNILACCLAHDFSLEQVKAARPRGATYLQGEGLEHVELSNATGWMQLDPAHLDLKRGRLLSLDDIPSPYLNGMLDEFLDDPNFCPIIETNRGCPYACTFCNWGAMGKSKSSMFSTDRVMAELDFIAERNKFKTPYLYIGDANFGLFQRDVSFAEHLRKLKDTVGFPQRVYLYYAKNSSKKVVEIAGLLKDMTRISLSRQTQNDQVLEIIKRDNISIDTFNALANRAKELGAESFVELIYTLPGESKASFLAGVRNIMRQNVDALHFFPAMLLDGSEMGTIASRQTYGIEGEWRQIDGCAGTYGPVSAMEFEEIITSTKAMSREDHFEIRLFHFMQSVFLDSKIYKDVEVLIGGQAHLVELIEDLITHREQAPAPFRSLIESFLADAASEFTREVPTSFTPEMVVTARGRSIKLNPLYAARLLHDTNVRAAFHQFLGRRIAAIGRASDEEIDAVLAYIDAHIYGFDGRQTYVVPLRIDAPAFAQRDRADSLDAFMLDQPRLFEFKKPFTYAEFIEDTPGDWPISRRVYEVLLHHTHETFRGTLLARLEGSVATSAAREIRLEGGWTY
jgi:radical SAM superfamily enzyme YgiQ (UPF0313 family)